MNMQSKPTLSFQPWLHPPSSQRLHSLHLLVSDLTSIQRGFHSQLLVRNFCLLVSNLTFKLRSLIALVLVYTSKPTLQKLHYQYHTHLM
jgi:hypothetical protein